MNKLPDLILQSPHNFSAANIYASKASLIRQTSPSVREGVTTMASTSRNLIVLSDGTGNSASKAFKTNVWRLYQALNLRNGKQVAVFGDGVGTSSVTLLRIIGLALGVGVKRNVLNLYKFMCHNYWREKQSDGRTESDRIWMF